MENKNDEELLKSAKKKFPKWAIALITLAVACCACAGVYLFAPGVKEKVDNKIALNTKDEDTYFKDTHKKAVDEKLEDNKETIEDTTKLISEKAGEIIAAKDGKGSFSLASLKLEETGVKAGYSIKISPELKEMILKAATKGDGDSEQSAASNQALGMATTLLNSINEISVESLAMTNAKDKVYADVSFTLNTKNLIKAEVILDLKEFAIYARIPEISDTYLSYKVPQGIIDQGKDAIKEALGQLKEQGKDAADVANKIVECLDKHQEDIVPLIKKYADTIIDNLGDVKIDKSAKIDIYDINIDCAKMTLEIDEAAAKKVVKAVMTELKDDEVIIDFVTAAGLPKDDYVKAIEEALKDIDDEAQEAKVEDGKKEDAEEKEDEMKIIINSYADSNGDIVAIDFKTNKDDSGFFFGSYEDGDTTTSEFRFTAVTYGSYVAKAKEAKERYEEEVEALTTAAKDGASENILPEKKTEEAEPSKSNQTVAVYMKDNNDKDSHTGKVILAVKDDSNKDNNLSVTAEYKDVKCNEDKGTADGKITISSDYEMIKDYSIVIDLEALEKGQKVTVALMQKDTELASISEFSQLIDYSEIKIPEKSAAVNDEAAIKAYIKAIKFDTLFANVKDALNNQQIGALIDMAGSKVNAIFNGNMDDKYVDELFSSIKKTAPSAADTDS